ncbi:MAG: regulator protein domain-like protein [Ramlibacter sp.]|nr:regulator protein domain-like protein [Ramlibacter sp.]
MILMTTIANGAARLAASLGLRSQTALRAGSRHPEDCGDPSLVDGATSLFNRTGLLIRGADLLAQCRRDGRTLTLAVFDCGDLLELRDVCGGLAGRKAVDRIVRGVRRLAGHGGIAARTGPTQFAVAMPVNRQRAERDIGRILDEPTRIELDGDDDELVFMPDLIVEVVPPELTLRACYVSLSRRLACIQAEQQRRLRHLARERERHCRPMPLVTTAARLPFVVPVPVMREVPPTMPMPLSRRH